VRPRAARIVRLVALVLLVPAVAGASATGPKPLQPRVYADTGVRLTDVVWTGTQFLYVENTTNRVYAAGPQGVPVRPFASMPNVVEETRCRLSPGAHGFAPGDVYCHAPDNTIYRIAADGTVSVFARLPDSSVSDGALAFDTVGRFGYALVAATGRSGAAEPSGGDVYAIDAAGEVRHIGTYPGLGGADEIVVAPARLAAGELLITVDAGSRGTLVLMDAHGRTRTIASLPDGPNPLAVIGAAPPTPPPPLLHPPPPPPPPPPPAARALLHRHRHDRRLPRPGSAAGTVRRRRDRRQRGERDVLGSATAAARARAADAPAADEHAGGDVRPRGRDLRRRLTGELERDLLEAGEVVAAREHVHIRQRRLHAAGQRLVRRVALQRVQPDDAVGEP
jgi:hypothetical protein